MTVQLSLSPLTIQNLYRIRGNPSSSIEWLVRAHNICGFPAPRIVSNRQSKQSFDVQLTPYVIGIVEGFSSYGMTQSQVVEWLVTEYISALKVTEQSEPKPEPKANLKVPKAKRESTTYPEKKPFIRSQEGGL